MIYREEQISGPGWLCHARKVHHSCPAAGESKRAQRSCRRKMTQPRSFLHPSAGGKASGGEQGGSWGARTELIAYGGVAIWLRAVDHLTKWPFTAVH